MTNTYELGGEVQFTKKNGPRKKGIEFEDRDMNGLDPLNPFTLVLFIVEYLCGAKYSAVFREKSKSFLESVICDLNLDKDTDEKVRNKIGEKEPILENMFLKALFKAEYQDVNKFLEALRGEGINCAQLNELLLLLDQDRVGEGFFSFFFEKDKLGFDDLRRGIMKFRGYAILCYGNVRYAYKKLRELDKIYIEQNIQTKIKLPIEPIEPRSDPIINIDRIEKEMTWFVGQLSADIIKREASITSDEKQKKYYSDRINEMNVTQQKAKRNSDIYLSWDYMDVYIATSMRHSWEFEECFQFVSDLFSGGELQRLNLRYFDPTQSYFGENRRIDKGLIEALMVKRAICTIYLAQESDTMGKDSELAATLAQGKPVIAYVPEIDISKHTATIEKYPLDYIRKRFLMLAADGIFGCKHEQVWKEMNINYENAQEDLYDFRKQHDNYRKEYPLSLFHETGSDVEFKGNLLTKYKLQKDFSEICRYIAVAEKINSDRRYQIFKTYHPLSIQVHLDTGVANGLLIVRTVDQCRRLLCDIMRGEMTFEIEKNEKERVTQLKESTTACPFRVVTDYEKLTNTFWNYYLSRSSLET